MRYLLLFFLFACGIQAQSLYNARANTTVSYQDAESFSVTFERSNYGFTFKQNDRSLTDNLKTKIERFMKNTDRPKYKGLGTFTLDIIKRNSKYYVVESKSPERLLEL